MQYSGSPFTFNCSSHRRIGGRSQNRVNVAHRVRRLHHQRRRRRLVHRQESFHLNRILPARKRPQPVVVVVRQDRYCCGLAVAACCWSRTVPRWRCARPAAGSDSSSSRCTGCRRSPAETARSPSCRSRRYTGCRAACAAAVVPCDARVTWYACRSFSTSPPASLRASIWTKSPAAAGPAAVRSEYCVLRRNAARPVHRSRRPLQFVPVVQRQRCRRDRAACWSDPRTRRRSAPRSRRAVAAPRPKNGAGGTSSPSAAPLPPICHRVTVDISAAHSTSFTLAARPHDLHRLSRPVGHLELHRTALRQRAESPARFRHRELAASHPAPRPTAATPSESSPCSPRSAAPAPRRARA